MKPSIFQLLATPFPRPKRSKKNLLYVVLVGVGCSLFILLYKPFGIYNNQNGDWWVDLIVFSLGIVFILAILFLEWFIPNILPKVFEKWTLGKAFLWYTFVILFTGFTVFVYKSYLAGFQEFTAIVFFQVLGRVLVIACTVSFVVLGVWQYFNKRKLTYLTFNETYTITNQNGKSVKLILKDILYIQSDDNYVDIHYVVNDQRKKEVFRSSLKNVEAQIVHALSPIFRCHRQYLINLEHFEIAKKSSRSLTLSLKNGEDQVPVSKSYVENITKQLFTHH